MEITNEIKAKVFAGYLPFYIGTPGSLALLKIIENLLLDKESRYRLSSLKPLSAITNEDAIEVSKILTEGFDLSFKRDKLNPLYFKSKTGASIEFSKRIIYYNEYDNETGTYYFEAYQFLQSRGYDLPQYLLGGKTLQESGLAIYE